MAEVFRFHARRPGTIMTTSHLHEPIGPPRHPHPSSGHEAILRSISNRPNPHPLATFDRS
jgi:hypothetical protein